MSEVVTPGIINSSDIPGNSNYGSGEVDPVAEQQRDVPLDHAPSNPKRAIGWVDPAHPEDAAMIESLGQHVANAAGSQITSGPPSPNMITGIPESPK